MSNQAAKIIMMMRPKLFGFDNESAASNAFQNSEGSEEEVRIQRSALSEFDEAVTCLRRANIDVRVFEDTDSPQKPNAVFPNNWISFHSDKAVLYPMMATNRRAERRIELIKEFNASGLRFEETYDLSTYEKDSKFLESTGSIIFDYDNRKAYACKSERTDPEVLAELCRILDYEPVVFEAFDRDGLAIYHTNVMMCLAKDYAVICLDAIPPVHRDMVVENLKQTGHDIVAINFDQMYAFAGNMIELKNTLSESILAMSQAAFDSLELAQIDQLKRYSALISIPIPTIEKYGGGSLRCMICKVD